MLLRYTPRGLESIRVRRRPPVIISLRKASTVTPAVPPTNSKSDMANMRKSEEDSTATAPTRLQMESHPNKDAHQKEEQQLKQKLGKPTATTTGGVVNPCCAQMVADRIVIPLKEQEEDYYGATGRRKQQQPQNLMDNDMENGIDNSSAMSSKPSSPPPPFMLLLEWNPVTKSHWLKWPMSSGGGGRIGMGANGSGSAASALQSRGAGKQRQGSHHYPPQSPLPPSPVSVTIYPSSTFVSALPAASAAAKKQQREKREMMVERAPQRNTNEMVPTMPVEAGGEQHPHTLRPGTMLELKQGDVIQFVQRPTSIIAASGEVKVVEYVYASNPRGINSGGAAGGKGGSTHGFCECSRCSAEGKRGVPRHQSSSSCDTRRRGERVERGSKGSSKGHHHPASDSDTTTDGSATAAAAALMKLPAIGVHGTAIHPKKHSDRFKTPSPKQQQPRRRLCELRTANGPIKTGQQQSVDLGTDGGNKQPIDRTMSAGPALASHLHRSSSTSKLTRGGSKHYADHTTHESLPRCVARPQVGSLLLQEILRLQSELMHKEAELLRAREWLASSTNSSPTLHAAAISGGPATPLYASQSLQFTSSAAQQMGNGQPPLPPQVRAQPMGTAQAFHFSSPVDSMGPLTKAQMNQIIYETFFHVCCTHLEALYNRISDASLREYADLYGELLRALGEPFSFHLMQVNTDCSVEFERLAYHNAEEKDQLYELFDTFLKAKIYPFARALDALIPLLRENAQLARDSGRASNLLADWSREFIDQLQLRPQWQVVELKVEDLQRQFRDAHIAKHWLLPALMPVLRVLVHEQRAREDKLAEKESLHAAHINAARATISELEQLIGIRHSPNIYDQQLLAQQEQLAVAGRSLKPLSVAEAAAMAAADCGGDGDSNHNSIPSSPPAPALPSEATNKSEVSGELPPSRRRLDTADEFESTVVEMVAVPKHNPTIVSLSPSTPAAPFDDSAPSIPSHRSDNHHVTTTPDEDDDAGGGDGENGGGSDVADSEMTETEVEDESGKRRRRRSGRGSSSAKSSKASTIVREEIRAEIVEEQIIQRALEAALAATPRMMSPSTQLGDGEEIETGVNDEVVRAEAELNAVNEVYQRMALERSDTFGSQSMASSEPPIGGDGGAMRKESTLSTSSAVAGAVAAASTHRELQRSATEGQLGGGGEKKDSSQGAAKKKELRFLNNNATASTTTVTTVMKDFSSGEATSANDARGAAQHKLECADGGGGCEKGSEEVKNNCSVEASPCKQLATSATAAVGGGGVEATMHNNDDDDDDESEQWLRAKRSQQQQRRSDETGDDNDATTVGASVPCAMAIEFWQLVSLLAQMLNVHLPHPAPIGSSRSSGEGREGEMAGKLHNAPEDEDEREHLEEEEVEEKEEEIRLRRHAVRAIMHELESVLQQLRAQQARILTTTSDDADYVGDGGSGDEKMRKASQSEKKSSQPNWTPMTYNYTTQAARRGFQ